MHIAFISLFPHSFISLFLHTAMETPWYISALIFNHSPLLLCSSHTGRLLFFTYTNDDLISGYLDLMYNFPWTFFNLVVAWLSLLPRSHLWLNVFISERNCLTNLAKIVFPIHAMPFFLNSALDLFSTFSSAFYIIVLLLVFILFSPFISSRSERIFVLTIVF